MMKQKRNRIKLIRKENKQFMKIWEMKPSRNYLKQLRKE